MGHGPSIAYLPRRSQSAAAEAREVQEGEDSSPAELGRQAEPKTLPASVGESSRGGVTLFRVGVVAMAASILPWFAMAGLPLLEISSARRAAYAGGLLVAAEVIFWVGAALAGRRTWRTVRKAGLRGAPEELWRLARHGGTPPGLRDDTRASATTPPGRFRRQTRSAL